MQLVHPSILHGNSAFLYVRYVLGRKFDIQHMNQSAHGVTFTAALLSGKFNYHKLSSV